MNKRVKEFFINENGFFTLFNSIDNDLFKYLFGELTSEKIVIFDEFFNFTVGNYLIYNDDYLPSKLVQFCILKCGESWKKLKDVIETDIVYNGKNYTETRTIDVNAYDSSTLVTGEKETIEHSENTDNELNLVEKGINFNKENHLIDMIIDDIKKMILIDIDLY